MSGIKVRNDAKTRGRRVKAARMLAGLTREALHNQYKIHPNTVKLWENPLASREGLTTKGAQRLVNALTHEGVTCTIDWLMSGTGPGPKLESDRHEIERHIDAASCVDLDEETLILREVEAFKNIHPEVIVIMVADDGMEPQYRVGDYIGGYKKYGDDILKHLKLPCLFELENGKIYFRHFLPRENGCFDLYCINSYATVTPHLILNAKILWAAPVVWHRSRENR